MTNAAIAITNPTAKWGTGIKNANLVEAGKLVFFFSPSLS
jgi:hypothetical protein